MIFLVAMLSLTPVLDEPQELRIVAAGPDDPIVWTLDGVKVATTHDREAAHIQVPAGSHELAAWTEHDGDWRILARPTATQGPGAAYVEGWSAVSEPKHEPLASDRAIPWTPIVLAVVALGLMVWRSEAGK